MLRDKTVRVISIDGELVESAQVSDADMWEIFHEMISRGVFGESVQLFENDSDRIIAEEFLD